jgi:hypothetical protein
MVAVAVQTGVVPAPDITLPSSLVSSAAAQAAQTLSGTSAASVFLGGTTVASTAAAAASTANAKRERQTQRQRLEQLKKEVSALQARRCAQLPLFCTARCALQAILSCTH